MPPYNAAHAKFNMAANMAPVPAAPGPPVPNLADIIPAGRNKKNTYAEDANDIITFVQAVVAIQLPADYDCKLIVDSNGQLTNYFLTLRLGIIAYIFTHAAHGRMTKTAMAALGTLREMENSAEAGVKAKWDDFQGPLFAYVFEAGIIPADSDIKPEALMDTSAIQFCNNVTAVPRCKGPVWSLNFLVDHAGGTAKDRGLCKGHNYELAILVDRLLKGFKDKVYLPKTRNVHVTAHERAHYFAGNDQFRIYPHDSTPVLWDYHVPGGNDDDDDDDDGLPKRRAGKAKGVASKAKGVAKGTRKRKAASGSSVEDIKRRSSARNIRGAN
jgi:hypothetical protein